MAKGKKKKDKKNKKKKNDRIILTDKPAKKLSHKKFAKLLGAELVTDNSVKKLSRNRFRMFPNTEAPKNIDIKDIPTILLFGTIATLESAHEPEDLKTAEENLKNWGITFEEGNSELIRRENKVKEQIDLDFEEGLRY